MKCERFILLDLTTWVLLPRPLQTAPWLRLLSVNKRLVNTSFQSNAPARDLTPELCKLHLNISSFVTKSGQTAEHMFSSLDPGQTTPPRERAAGQSRVSYV